MNRIDADFRSEGQKCAAWLYLPEAEKPPIVVMAHGFAAERTFRLPAFAERFAQKGLAVLLFDYRNFGGSDGEPRNFVDPRRHLEDWAAAIAKARDLDDVDGSRLGLWGTSFSGGHVLVTAAGDGRVKAVVAQVPFVDGIRTALHFPPSYSLTGLKHGIKDKLREMLGKEPHYIPVVADPSEFGLMNTPESKPGYLALVPQGSSWQNRTPARIALSIAFHRPISYAADIACPTLIVIAEKDSLIAEHDASLCASRIPNAEVVKFPIGHFDIYAGEFFEKAIEVEAAFLVKHLLT